MKKKDRKTVFNIKVNNTNI